MEDKVLRSVVEYPHNEYFLPQNIWNSVFEYLNNNDYLSIVLVSKQWRTNLHTSLESLTVTLGE